jgi:hypothetical protein
MARTPEGKEIKPDLNPLGKRFGELETVEKNRDIKREKLRTIAEALAKETDPNKKQKLSENFSDAHHDLSMASSDLAQAYLRAGRELQGLTDLLKTRAQELDNPKMAGKKGWDRETLGSLNDLLLTTIREARKALACDPLARDPDYGGLARSVVKLLDQISGSTRLELIARANSDKPQQYWKKTMKQELAKLKKAKLDSGAIEKRFGNKLDQLLSSWSEQVSKFPRQDREVSRQLVIEMNSTLQNFRTAVRQTMPDKRALGVAGGLLEGIDAVSTMITLQLRKFDQRGGMFN